MDGLVAVETTRALSTAPDTASSGTTYPLLFTLLQLHSLQRAIAGPSECKITKTSSIVSCRHSMHELIQRSVISR